MGLETRQHPLRRLAGIIEELEQMIRDVEWWNRNRTDAEPIDCETERVGLAHCRKMLVAWGEGRMQDYDRMTGELIGIMGL